MANDYTTSTDAFTDISEGNYSSSDYPQMATMITAASRLVDKELGKQDGFFYPTTDEVTMYYNGSGCAELDVDEFVSISEVAVSETGRISSTDYIVWNATDYYTEPYNRAPIKKIVCDVLNGSKVGFYGYRKGVRVTGVIGYSTTTPSLIEQSVKRQAVRWFMQAKQGYQDTGTQVNIGGMNFSKEQLDPDIKKMLWPYVLEFSA